MDLKIETEEIKLKVRANGAIINDDKVLMCQINNSGFWCLPGGHIHLGEDSKTASLREINEEVGISFDEILDFANPRDVEVKIMHFWCDEHLPMHSVDAAIL